MNNDLYRVTTTTKEFGGCRNVTFYWFRDEKTPRPYAELIKDYDPNDEYVVYAEDNVEEKFTEAEAALLKEYLDRRHPGDVTTTIEKVSLPLPNNILPLGAKPVGGGDNIYMLHEESEYSLPFKTLGYYDLVGCELIDNPGETFRHYLLVLDKDGAHVETQEEARRREDAPVNPSEQPS